MNFSHQEQYVKTYAKYGRCSSISNCTFRLKIWTASPKFLIFRSRFNRVWSVGPCFDLYFDDKLTLIFRDELTDDLTDDELRQLLLVETWNQFHRIDNLSLTLAIHPRYFQFWKKVRTSILLHSATPNYQPP